MHIAEKGEGPVVLFLHGFPELWYSWRHQIVSLSARGYHAVAPDLRGYGDTDVPSSISAYTAFHVDYIHGGGFKQDVPNLEQVVVQEGVGHFNNQETPEQISTYIYDFINKF
ncbi:non-specific protein-tyrosine kinase [Senna tora]|uniref:Non-specific protein-tyrosine kinase n=1 Tax=Senna tora TaxID=362788 RepID=A0A834X6M1_9FABA|nr:non-specific protein-tyrosine kinase [Senna tora]